MTFAIYFSKKHDVKAPLKREVLVNHLADSLGFYFPCVRVCLRVMQEVHDDIIREKIVDIVDEVAEVNCHIGVLLISCFLCPVEQSVDQEVLTVINDIGFQLWVFENAVDVLIGCAGLDLIVTLEGKTAFLHRKDSSGIGLQPLDGIGLSRRTLAKD